MLCAIHNRLYRSHKAIVASVVLAWLLSVSGICSAQSMDTVLSSQPNNYLSAVTTPNRHAAHHGAHDSSHQSSTQSGENQAQAVMPCCDDKNGERNQLVAQLCCEPVDGIVTVLDKQLSSVVFIDQMFVSLWPLPQNPPLLSLSLIDSSPAYNFPALYLTLGVQLI